jgi:hypothetical protein
VSDPRFDAEALFDEDYLYFYEPLLEEVSDLCGRGHAHAALARRKL